MQMSRLMVWSTEFSDDERSETEYRLSADETPLTLSGLPPENRDNSRDNIRTQHFIIAKIHIFTQRSKRNQHRDKGPQKKNKILSERSLIDEFYDGKDKVKHFYRYALADNFAFL